MRKPKQPVYCVVCEHTNGNIANGSNPHRPVCKTCEQALADADTMLQQHGSQLMLLAIAAAFQGCEGAATLGDVGNTIALLARIEY
jgi:hypothetical protein